MRYGARLARTTGLPLLVSGGGIGNETAEAVLMKSALEEDFGLTVRWAEARSRDTRENALFSAQILREADVRHVLLVTHAMHMPRAQAAFESAGLIVTPAPTGWLADHGAPPKRASCPVSSPMRTVPMPAGSRCTRRSDDWSTACRNDRPCERPP
ncbi:YdcF family protein [Thauera humireducens]|uniref:YdcF family protein n=1 Tax=Thauera humireducens TaxID=1134435 RepID=UPI00311FC65A